MNLHHQFDKQHPLDLGGSYKTVENHSPALPDNIFAEDAVASELYPEPEPPSLKKHSTDFLQNRVKLRHIAAKRLNHLSEELYKLANEVRYYDPLIAEALDDAWDATTEAIARLDESN